MSAKIRTPAEVWALSKRARSLYEEQGMSLDAVCRELHAHHKTVHAWIVAAGGSIRVYHGRKKAARATSASGKRKGPEPKKRWGAGVKCIIGGEQSGDSWAPVPIGSYYCAECCDWTNCQSPVPCRWFDEATRACTASAPTEDGVPFAPCKYRRDMCGEEVTETNRVGFTEFKAERAEKKRKIVADENNEGLQRALRLARDEERREMERRQLEAGG